MLSVANHYNTLYNRHKKCHYLIKFLPIIRSYLSHELTAKRGGSSLSFTADDVEVEFPRVPGQRNSCDCGVYLLHYVELIFGVRKKK